MKTGKVFITMAILLCTSLIVAEEYTPEQKQELGIKAVHEMMHKIFSASFHEPLFAPILVSVQEYILLLP